MSQTHTISPKTGRVILVGGPTYARLAKDPRYAGRLVPKPFAASKSKPKGRSAKRPVVSKSGGCSNQRKYIGKGIPASSFCGPEGGACSGTFPVNTPGRARAALAYARHAPNPEGIRRCTHRIARAKGWEDPLTGKIRVR